MSRIPRGGAIPRPSTSRTGAVAPCEAAGASASGKPSSKSAKMTGSRSSFRTASKTSVTTTKPKKIKPVVEKPKPVKKMFELPPLSTMSKMGPKG